MAKISGATVEFSLGSNEVDPKLPSGCKVVSVSRHDTSRWANLGRINIKLEDGTLVSYFIKVATNNIGRQMIHGEFESMSAIHAIVPDFVPKPIARGTYVTEPDTHFFLCKYRRLTREIPEPLPFAARLAALHQSESPDGRYGFPVNTFNGNLCEDNSWEDTWEKLFAKSLRHMLSHGVATQGPCEEIEHLIHPLFEKVMGTLGWVGIRTNL